MRNLLLDLNNLYSRSKYATRESDKQLYVALIANSMFTMIREAHRRFNPDNVIGFFDGHTSWRKLVYPAYKANREKDLTLKEIEMKEASDNFLRNMYEPFLKEKTYMPIIDCDLLEADDLIATFCYLHPNDENIICSTDGDFIQLLTKTTSIYNSMENRLTTLDGVFDTQTNKKLVFTLKDGKVVVGKELIYVQDGEQAIPFENWNDYCLFVKCIRGDHSDNIRSAYPKITEKSTSKRIGMYDAYMSQFKDSFEWNSFMTSTCEDLDGNVKKVSDTYTLNKILIDLKMLPSDLRVLAENKIKERTNKTIDGNPAMHLRKFLQTMHLDRLLEEFDGLTKPYIVKYSEDNEHEVNL